MARFIHSADIHLDSPLVRLERYEGAPVEAVRGATRQAMENLIRLAVEESVDFLLISGDLYDGDWKDYNTGLYLVSRMKDLKDAGIPVFIVAGNHDAASRMTKCLRLPDNVFLFPTDNPATRILEDLGVAIHGQGFARPAITTDLSSRYPPPIPGLYNIGMLHTSAAGRPGHEPYAPCSPEQLIRKGYHYWALGHVHQAEVLLSDPWVVFSGNIQGRHIRETGAKGCYLVDSERRSAHFHPCDVVRWEHIEIRMEHGLSDLMERIENSLIQVCDRNMDIPLVVRLSLTADGLLQRRWNPDIESITNDIRALAIDAGDGRVWIQDIQAVLRRNSLTRPALGGSDPWSEIQEIFRELETDPDRLAEAASVLEDFRTRLPLELRDGPDAAFSLDPDWMKDILHETEAMLTARLFGRSSESADYR